MTITLSNICFAYSEAPEKQVLNIPDWSVGSSEHIFVQGPSGCGKSTLLNVLNGLLAPSTGEVTVLGERLDQMSARKRDQFRANHIGCVFQQFNLIPYLNAVENIQLASHFSKNSKASSLQDDIADLLGKLNLANEDWYKPTNKLSMGQQQRVAIARALINKPELLIADEPTSSLDQQNRDKFMSEIMSLVSEHQITLVFVSHDSSLSRHFQRVDTLNEINQFGSS
ncbi:MAG: ABC transporter ATP-binding protein [Acidiferrobacterales bacterium]|nr:ABC transporter ATP-binding protein [Acidiferrobacterales bacterium]